MGAQRRRAPRQLGRADRRSLQPGAAQRPVVWEVAIKRSLGKLDAPEDFAATLLRAGAQALAISVEHADAVARLEWHHRDPFDRLLIAQAKLEHAVLVTNDPALHAYGTPLVW